MGIVVDGDHVTMYGLAAEHTLKDLTVWNGNHGRTYFYQSELPYGVDVEWGTKGYVGYRVGDSVTSHTAKGVGVYHYFRNYPVVTYTGIKCPEDLVSSFEAPIGVYLNGKGTMQHVINSHGSSTSAN